jgi:hypothetical protein
MRNRPPGERARRVTDVVAAVIVMLAFFAACDDADPISNSDSAGRAGSGAEAGETTAGTSGAMGGSGGRALNGEYVHREEATTCPFPERIDESGNGGEGGAPTGGRCDSDDDCTDKPHGYCIRSNAIPIPVVGCRYACETDADCAETEVCACGSSERVSTGSFIALGICAKSTCATDDDCTNGALCISPLSNACRITRPFSFHCQTPADECRGGRDCGPAGVCHHFDGRFTCAVC